MNTYTRPDAIIDFCLAPLQLNPMNEATHETRRRLEHVIRTFQLKAAQPVAVDFSQMPTLVINEAAHGYE
ncbi:hypothetical protein PQU92_18380 [Asticcacaulis sp. BYS171W]|uniref:Uncharacterized protein n=1 Tax=Asticcacaulis aquaticus TaxID=2984212 RepID=A0ABT5HYU5_9CAUL|nr:hypothetical protein [Asticcacaulis aquaticus]MDC7685255.1 hypothetical protein [Asticcacaulis aquaticus]